MHCKNWLCTEASPKARRKNDRRVVAGKSGSIALINRLGFVLEEEYGVTDMVQKYSCQGFSFTLEYMGYDMDAIFFRVHTEGEEIPQCYLDAAEYLNSLEVSEDG